MKKYLEKIDLSLILELLGVGLLAYGVAYFSVPVSCIVTGLFLIWVTEKGNV
tara:strand:- start:1097 stop:1252 length:156 start_codon:yes stop_codon:yes gene_type:complete